MSACLCDWLNVRFVPKADISRVQTMFAVHPKFGGAKEMADKCLPHAAGVDCFLYLINRGIRCQGIGGRSDRRAMSAVPNEDLKR